MIKGTQTLNQHPWLGREAAARVERARPKGRAAKELDNL
jgi:hypothetical protein